MYFTFSCPHCEKKLKIREELAGRSCRCPYCRSSIAVPTPPGFGEEQVEDYSGLGNLNIDISPPPPPPPPSGARPGGPAIDPIVPSVAAPRASVADRVKAQARQRSASHGGTGGNGTDVSMLLSGLMGLAFAAVFFSLLAPFYQTAVGKMFFGQSLSIGATGIPVALVVFMGWSIAILILKVRLLRRQKQSMLFDLLPSEISQEITVAKVDDFVRNIRSLPLDGSQSFLINRVVRGLEHFRIRKSTPEAASMLASQSEIDANSVDSSYTLLNVFIWAIPILGFIGTVIGISQAVGGFSSDLTSAADIEQMKESLNAVTGGLATAFETTLIALVMSILIMFPSSSLRKAEEDLLNWVDEYTNENLLRRLNDGREGGAERGSGGSPTAIVSAVNTALAPHHKELRQWHDSLQAIGQTLSKHVVDGWRDVNEQLGQQHDKKMAELARAESLVGEFHMALADLAGRTAELQGTTSQSLEQTMQSVQGSLMEVQTGLRGLSDVLAQLGQQQVVIQQVDRRRGWWPFGRR